MSAIKLLEEARYYVELRMNAKDMIDLDIECERDILARIDALLKTGSCEWRESGNEYESDGWETSCGNMFVLNDGTPKQNDMGFCCYCGKPLVERSIEPPLESDHD